MTHIYFVRHAEPNYNNHDDLTRELTAKGWADRERVCTFLEGKGISRAYSSPFKRSIDTISAFTEKHQLPVTLYDDFRERGIGPWLEDFNSYAKKQWSDFSYAIEGGESLAEVQKRNIAALTKVLKECDGQNIVIGTHGTALSCIINYYDKSFGYDDFERIKAILPWLVEMHFDGEKFISWQEHQLGE